MDAQTLDDAMGGAVTLARYQQLAPAFSAALVAAQCTTPARAAMFCAQVGHESLGLRYMEEIADGSAYEGRRDLGNVQHGDGVRFKGRGPIQITGRGHYTDLSTWAFGRGLVPSRTFFIDNPAQLATDTYGFLGAVWYWTVARPNLNAMSDAGDVEAATRAVNGGVAGLDARRTRWLRCRALGDALLAGAPTPAALTSTTTGGTDMDGRQAAQLDTLLAQITGSVEPWKFAGYPTWKGGTDEQLTLVDYMRRGNVETRQLRIAVDALAKQLATGSPVPAELTSAEAAPLDLDTLAELVADKLFARVVAHGPAAA